MGFTNLFILDTSLTDIAGHHFEYAKAVSEAAARRAVPTVVVCNLRATNAVKSTMKVVPVFHMGTYDRVLSWKWLPSLSKKLNTVLFIIRFLIDWWMMRMPELISKETLVFVPTCAEGSVFGLIIWLKLLPSFKRPKVVCLFRYDPRGMMNFVARIMRGLVNEGVIILATDSDDLSRDYKVRTGLRFHVLPIPHIPVSVEKDFHFDRASKPIRLTYLGDARIEKGLDTLLGAIHLLDQAIRERRIEFVIQSSVFLATNGIGSVVEQLQKLESEHEFGVKLIREPMDTRSYYALLASSDVVVLPYRKAVYHSRTSGILVEAIAAGKPVIVSNGTWMASQVKQHGSGMIIEEDNASDLARAVQTVAAKIDELRDQAEQKAVAWRARHNADRLLDTLLDLCERMPAN